MSSDIERFLAQPQDLFWDSDNETDIRQRYHELDAPLTRYLIGIGRLITKQPALPSDWNWAGTWIENSNAGALPNDKLLNISRFSVAFLFPFSLLMMYYIGKSIGNNFIAWSSVLLFSGNSFVLLHSRRAMAESVLLFTIILFLFLIIVLRDKPWALSISSALAFNAKQSAVVFFILGLIAIFWPAKNSPTKKNISKNFGIYILIFLITTLILNPFLWSDPIKAAMAALEARSDLVNRQVTTIDNLDTNKYLDSIPKRVTSLIAQVYFTPPATADVGNYLENTALVDNRYLNNFFHHIFSGFVAGGVLLFLTLFGFFLTLMKIIRSRSNFIKNRKSVLVFIGSTLQVCTILLMIPISFQRYYAPLIPFTILWISFGLNFFFELIWNKATVPKNE
jgi:4-amino-4-deoxy-L-arabinose transferase-like glycosyltransferase